MLVHLDKTLVQVRAGSERRRTCRACGQPVVWFLTVTRERPMLFNGGVVSWKTSVDLVTGEPLLHLDRAECHWARCASRGEGDA